MAGSFVPPRESFPPGHFPQVLRLAAVPSRSSTLQCPGLQGGGVEVAVDEVSRCSTRVWTAVTAVPVPLRALKAAVYGWSCPAVTCCHLDAFKSLFYFTTRNNLSLVVTITPFFSWSPCSFRFPTTNHIVAESFLPVFLKYTFEVLLPIWVFPFSDTLCFQPTSKLAHFKIHFISKQIKNTNSNN